MLSETLRSTLEDLVEESERQEDIIDNKNSDIQSIVTRCEHVLRFEPLTKVGKGILEEIIEEYKEDI
ncbi:hypothetical protein [Clostridium algidicarnis]|uniref:hypothetical protein n=1 Tax=Clostridium algidicarnis TaxID=37659 RepID=UPI001C0AE688|nr:hypothetical protein [Clostridium algidicarnis]MBU3226780.1 hypothetical protein [Clostridium algidicarnis]MBU3250309.1 hypothetical protein [Clostridium algidicarnis]